MLVQRRRTIRATSAWTIQKSKHDMKVPGAANWIQNQDSTSMK